MSLVLDEHREYLSDVARVDAFRRAIAEVVKPGHVVVDLGCGTGILGLLACRAGAARVYAIDAGGMLEVAREVCAANKFADRVTFLKGFSRHLQLPERADVMVADQIGHFGFEAGLLDYFDDARRRFLKPGGTMVPAQIDLQIAAVEAPELWEQTAFWSRSPAGFDFTPAQVIAANTGYPTKFGSDQLLTEPATGQALDLTNPTAPSFSMGQTFTLMRPGTLHGIGGWFSAQLSPHVRMTNSPLAADRINRRNVFFPIERPVPVGRGDRVRVTFQIRPIDVVVTWTVEVWKAGRDDRPTALFHHSTLRGMLLSREDLQRTRPDFVPTLTPRGVARQTVLTLCDGTRPLAEVEQEVWRRHADLFSSQGEAATFVAEVVTRYAR